MRAQIPLKPALQRVDLRAEDHAVNGSEDQRGAVQVDQLAEREPRGMIDPRLVGKRRLDRLPAGFRRRQRVVAVADREKEAAALRLHPRDLLRRPRGQLALDRVPGDVPAAEHQLRVVELGQLPIRQRLDQAHGRVVDEHHRVRAFDARPLPDAHARRDARENRPLRRADGRARAGREVILLQIQPADQPEAFSALGHAADEHKAVFHARLQHAAPHIVFHCLPDGRNPRVAFGQIGLGIDEVQRARRVADDLRGLPPVFGLAGKLVAGDNRPFFKICRSVGQKDIRRENTGLPLAQSFRIGAPPRAARLSLG